MSLDELEEGAPDRALGPTCERHVDLVSHSGALLEMLLARALRHAVCAARRVEDVLVLAQQRVELGNGVDVLEAESVDEDRRVVPAVRVRQRPRRVLGRRLEGRMLFAKRAERLLVARRHAPRRRLQDVYQGPRIAARCRMVDDRIVVVPVYVLVDDGGCLRRHLIHAQLGDENFGPLGLLRRLEPHGVDGHARDDDAFLRRVAETDKQVLQKLQARGASRIDKRSEGDVVVVHPGAAIGKQVHGVCARRRPP
mmetsp:Transcript_17207/g.33553  ORF Transcript_17207/g.33553 Transcript_17207/m.33553 type:complete len:253 (-) Transcript_17207:317-1075(-)